MIRAFAWTLGLGAGTDLNCGLRVPYLSLLPNRYSASMASTMIMLPRDYPLAMIHDLGFPSLSVVLVLAGLILILQGFIADQISHMRLSQLESASFANK